LQFCDLEEIGRKFFIRVENTKNSAFLLRGRKVGPMGGRGLAGMLEAFPL
jgi:hypothetical protein